MTTTFSLLLSRCGLSHREAADHLGVRPDTVRSWSCGRNPTPSGVIAELRALYHAIEIAAARHVAEIEWLIAWQRPESVEIGLAATDAEARARPIGLPCVGAHAALIGLVAARLDVPVVVVPRGSSPASRAAKRAHEAT